MIVSRCAERLLLKLRSFESLRSLRSCPLVTNGSDPFGSDMVVWHHNASGRP